MVATRRGARTDHTEEPEAQDASLTLRKKPVRRATAATAATAAKTAQAAPTTRATRSKKATQDQEDELALPEQPQDAPVEPEATAKRTTRSKRAETVEPEPSRSTKAAKPIPQPKRTTRAAPAPAAQEPKPAPAAATTKPTLAARPARQTRAKTPVASSPLSPKKITQVSRAPRTRNAKATEDEKAKPARNTRPLPATQTTRTSRKRNVSDENAEIPNLRHIAEIEVAAQPIKAISPSKKSPVKEAPVEEEGELSSRETTPSVASGPVFEQPKDYTEDHIDAGDLDQSDDGTETAEQSTSDDELCGPKTPMRRTRRTQAQSHASSKSNAKRIAPEIPEHTPPRRRGTRDRTPQTQKPHNQTATSESVVRPMTVARATDRPFVFRKLQEHPTPMPNSPAMTATEDDHVEDTETAAEETEEDDQEERDDVEMAESEDEAVNHHRDGGESDPDETIVFNDDGENECRGSELAETMEIELPDFSHELVVNTVDEESSVIEPPVLEEGADAIDSSLIEPPTAEYEDDYGMELDSPTAEPPVASYEVDLDGSVIVHSRDGSDSEEASEDEEDRFCEFGLKTPKPETIPWQNIREDTTIPIDFDLHFADARSPVRVHDHFSYDAAPVMQDLQSGEIDTLLAPGQAFDQGIEDPTINLNDFVDMAALTEPTLQLDIFAGAVGDDSQEQCDNEDLSNQLDDTENTVIITKIESPVLETLESAEEPDENCDASPPSNKLRSGMMRESLQQLASMDNETGRDTTVESRGGDDMFEEIDGEFTPHYALSTLSSRRKSLPALGNQTPAKSSARPTTSDGASIARVAHPFDHSWWSRSRRSSVVGVDNPATPVRSASTRRMSSARRPTAITEQSSRSSVKTPTTQLGERFPRRTPRDRYDGQSEAQTIAAPTRFNTPGQVPVRYPATVQKLASQRTKEPSNTDQRIASTPIPDSTSLHDGESEQAKSFDMPFRVRDPASTPEKRSEIVLKDEPEGASGVSGSSAEVVLHATPQERFPRRSARQTYDQQASTVAAPARFHTPIQGKPRRPATVQRLASQLASQSGPSSKRAKPTQTPRGSEPQRTPSAVTASPATPSARTPQAARFPRLPPKEAYDEHADAETKPLPATPKARFPRLPPKQTYDERASTVIAPSRFRSPAHASPRRPATSQKPVNLRKVALKSAAPAGYHTPVKTPLRAPGETPSQVPMTPHPGAPLRGVLALVEVFTLDGASASAPFVSLLQRLGAKTTKSWSERVTHVIFKDGSPTTLQRVRLNNKEVEKSGKGFMIHCVNSRWVSDCDASGSRVDEDDDAYAVDVTEVPRGGNRRRKSMEPSALVNIGGNIVRDRKSSGRQSIGRSAMKPDSSEKSENDIDFTPVAKWQSLPDDDDFEDDESELSTPDYLAAPDKLVQMTAPMNRVRKLDLQKDDSKNRRMTSFWEGGE